MLHGIARTKRTMNKLQRHFEQNEYRVLNVDYPSRKHPIDELASRIHPDIEKFNEAEVPLHFVGYSLGGLVTRAYIAKHRPPNLGRVVMVGTPNHGSEVADFLRKNAYAPSFWFYGPAGEQLITQPAYGDGLPPIDYEAGCIAGDWTNDPVSSLVLIRKPNDGKVSIESSQAPGMRDHIVLHATHTFMMQNPKAIHQVRHFIENGKFHREE